MKLGCFCGIGQNGETIILEISLLQTETIEDFAFAFRSFTAKFESDPKTIYTDGDAAIKEAIRISFGSSTVHFLCTFHIWKNFFTNLHPVVDNSKLCLSHFLICSE